MTKKLRDQIYDMADAGGDIGCEEVYQFIKENFSPKKTNKNPKIPDLEDVKKFFDENGYTSAHAEHVYNYYNDADWKDAKGSPVLAWKQKMRGNWFKEDGKKPKTFSWESLTLEQAMEYKKSHGKAFISKLEFERPDLYLELT